MLFIRKWKKTRYWALEKGSPERTDNTLIALFVYRKGARNVLVEMMEKERLARLFANFRYVDDLVEKRSSHERRSPHP